METEDEVALDYIFDLKGVTIVVCSHTEQRGISSLYSLYSGADYPEREAAGLFQIKFLGNPNLTTPRISEPPAGEKMS